MNLSTASSNAAIEAGFRRNAVQQRISSVGSGIADCSTTGKPENTA
ncbi:hypothetical protein OKW27_003837 [Paraburkholderia sp. 35.1]